MTNKSEAYKQNNINLKKIEFKLNIELERGENGKD